MVMLGSAATAGAAAASATATAQRPLRQLPPSFSSRRRCCAVRSSPPTTHLLHTSPSRPAAATTHATHATAAAASPVRWPSNRPAAAPRRAASRASVTRTAAVSDPDVDGGESFVESGERKVTRTSLHRLKVGDIRAQLERRGLNTDGKKPELVERLFDAAAVASSGVDTPFASAVDGAGAVASAAAAAADSTSASTPADAAAAAVDVRLYSDMTTTMAYEDFAAGAEASIDDATDERERKSHGGSASNKWNDRLAAERSSREEAGPYIAASFSLPLTRQADVKLKLS